MTEIALVLVSITADLAIIGMVLMGYKLIVEDRKEREMLVKMIKAKDIQEFEYIMVDDKDNIERGAIDEDNPDIVDLEKINIEGK